MFNTVLYHCIIQTHISFFLFIDITLKFDKLLSSKEFFKYFFILFIHEMEYLLSNEEGGIIIAIEENLNISVKAFDPHMKKKTYFNLNFFHTYLLIFQLFLILLLKNLNGSNNNLSKIQLNHNLKNIYLRIKGTYSILYIRIISKLFIYLLIKLYTIL